MNLLQHRPQGFPEDMGLPHRPPVLEVDGQRGECQVNRDWDEKV
jgi:hypothetical protein